MYNSWNESKVLLLRVMGKYFVENTNKEAWTVLRIYAELCRSLCNSINLSTIISKFVYTVSENKVQNTTIEGFGKYLMEYTHEIAWTTSRISAKLCQSINDFVKYRGIIKNCRYCFWKRVQNTSLESYGKIFNGKPTWEGMDCVTN